MTAIIGIDLGTTTIKAARFTPDGEMIALGTRPFRKPGEHELPLSRAIKPVYVALGEILHDEDRDDPPPFGIASQTNSFVVEYTGLIKRESPLYIWTGNWAQSEADLLNRQIRLDQIAAHTGMTELTGQSMLPKCLHLMQAEPKHWRHVKQISLLPDQLIHAITRRPATTNGSLWPLTGLYDIEANDYWTAALNQIDLTPDQLPHLTPQPGTQPTTTSTLDHLAAAIGVGNVCPGQASISLGTTSCVVVTHVNRPPVTTDSVIGRHPADANLWYKLTWSGLSSSGLNWYATRVKRTIPDLLTETETTEPNANGWRAEPCDPMDVDAGFRFMNDSTDAAAQPTNGQAVRAILACLSREISRLLVLAAADELVERVFATGGGAQSDVWLQTLANELRRPVARPECAESAARGAALLASHSAGFIPSLAEIEHPVARTFIPQR